MLTRRQLWALVALTLMWGVNWPMMKLSLQELTPLYFRASTMMVGALLMLAWIGRSGERLWPRRGEWATIAWLALPNILGWHGLSIFGVQELASGRAAILGFTMPIFTVLLGALFFGERITRRVQLALLAAGTAIGLLLWHELQSISGRPVGIAWMLGAALCWAVGTLMFRRARFDLSATVITVWMLLLCSGVLWVLAITIEPVPVLSRLSPAVWMALAYAVFLNNSVGQLLWFGLARGLPPATSAMSVMAIPLVGTLSATFIVGEIPYWQDWLAIVFVMIAIASVLLPSRGAKRPGPAPSAQ